MVPEKKTMPYRIHCYGVTRFPDVRHRTRVDCFVMFDHREPYYPLAREYFLEKEAPYQGHEVLKNEPRLAEQPHVVGEALVQRHYFAPQGLVLLEPSSRQVLGEAPPEREPDAVHDDVRIWVTRMELPLTCCLKQKRHRREEYGADTLPHN